MTTRRHAATAALVLGLALAPAALAQTAADTSAARDLFKEGSQLAQQGKWPEARDRYERSLKLKRAAITLYSLGVAQHKTGHLAEALESFRAFLAEPEQPATKPWQEPAREAMAELEKRVAQLEIKIAPPGLEGLLVKVDGHEVPAIALDRKRLMNPGLHEVVASAPGHREARAAVTLAEGGQGSVSLKLEPGPDESDPGQPPVAQPLAPAQATASQPAAADEGEAPSRLLPFSLIGGGVAALGVGIAVGMIGVSQASDAPTSDGPEADSARTKMLVGDILGGVGIVSAGIGVVVLLVQGGPAKPAKTGRASPVSPFLAGRGAGVRVQF